MKIDCERKGKFFGGCKFQPRYNLIPPVAPAGYSGCYLTEYLAALTKREYVCDVCIRCGKTVERKP